MALSRRRADEQAGVRRRCSPASLAFLMNRQRDATGLIAFDEQISLRLPASARRGHLHACCSRSSGFAPGRRSDVGRPLHQLAEALVKRSLVVLISDLLDDPEPVIKGLRHLKVARQRRHRLPGARPERADVSVPRCVAIQGSRERRRGDRGPASVRTAYLQALASLTLRRTTASCAARASTTFSSTRRSRSISRCSAYLSARARRK